MKCDSQGAPVNLKFQEWPEEEDQWKNVGCYCPLSVLTLFNSGWSWKRLVQNRTSVVSILRESPILLWNSVLFEFLDLWLDVCAQHLIIIEFPDSFFIHLRAAFHTTVFQIHQTNKFSLCNLQHWISFWFLPSKYRLFEHLQFMTCVRNSQQQQQVLHKIVEMNDKFSIQDSVKEISWTKTLLVEFDVLLLSSTEMGELAFSWFSLLWSSESLNIRLIFSGTYLSKSGSRIWLY